MDIWVSWLKLFPPRWSRGVLVLLWLVTPDLPGATFPLVWRWSNPRPHGNNIYDLAYSPQLNLAVQVTERGQIYTSSDLNFWTPRSSGTTLYLRSVTFFGAVAPRILVTGQNGTVLYADNPADFQVGSLLDGPTSDWLEGVAASPTVAVAVGDNGVIYTSPDGALWKRQAAGITEYLRGVAFGAGYFVAVGDNGFVARSLNGTNWTTLPRINGVQFNRVDFDGTRFTAVGDAGATYASSNAGLTWQNTPSGATSALFEADSGNGTRLVAGENEVRLEEGGIWSNALALAQPPPSWTYYASLGRPNFFLLGGRTGLMAEGFKTNSGPWLWGQSDRSFRHWLFDMFYATNLYVAVGDRATIMTSGNGVDWTLELTPAPLTNAIFLGVGGTTNLLIGVGSKGSLMLSPNIQTNFTSIITNDSGSVLTNTVLSTLGIVWHPRPPPTTNDLQGVAFGQNLYLVTGDNGFIMSSLDGTNWTPRPNPSTTLLSGATAFPGGFVVVGDDGTIMSSPDAVTWTPRNAATDNWLYKVRYLQGRLVAVGQNGTIRTSTDGISWTNPASGASAWLTDVTWVDGSYFVVGTQGTVLSSPDALTWTSQGTITLKSLYAAATDGTYLMTGGVEGVILRSPIIPDLSPMSILSYARIQDEHTTNYAQNLYLFGGKTDQQFTLDSRTNLQVGAWSTGPFLEFFESSGTLFYLESLPLQGAPPAEFYQGNLIPPH